MSEFLNQPHTEYFKTRLQQNQKLLDAIKAELPELECLLRSFQGMYEDGIYRFYHHSFKVYQLQNWTLRALEVFTSVAKTTNNQLSTWFEQIVKAGTGFEWKLEHNADWMLYARPIVEAFLHAKYFLEMMIKYGREMHEAPTSLPSGWASVLELYGQR